MVNYDYKLYYELIKWTSIRENVLFTLLIQSNTYVYNITYVLYFSRYNRESYYSLILVTLVEKFLHTHTLQWIHKYIYKITPKIYYSNEAYYVKSLASIFLHNVHDLCKHCKQS